VSYLRSFSHCRCQALLTTYTSDPSPPWHRPYVMVLEQSIGLVATAIAQEFASKASAAQAQKWLEAAKDLRFPFWDWTLEDHVDGGFPEVLKRMEVRPEFLSCHLAMEKLTCTTVRYIRLASSGQT